MTITLLSVNTAKVEPIGTRRGRSGIFKRPQTGQVAVDEFGLAGDAIVDRDNHGGFDQAVYIYTQPDYDHWSAELGERCEPGLFGENLTFSGLDSAAVRVGDRYRIGDVVLEATSPRIPCSTFAKRMNDSQWVKRFYAGKRPGMYCRVIEPGPLSAGEAVTVIPFDGETVTLGELFSVYPYEGITTRDRERYLATPVHRKLAAYLRGERRKP